MGQDRADDLGERALGIRNGNSHDGGVQRPMRRTASTDIGIPMSWDLPMTAAVAAAAGPSVAWGEGGFACEPDPCGNRTGTHGEVRRPRIELFELHYSIVFKRISIMARGGRRPGAGRPKGAKSKALQSTREPPGTPETVRRQQVALLSADGMAPAVIATVLGVSVEQLHAEFGHELEHGPAIIRAQQLLALSAASARGTVTAQRVLLDRASPSRSEQASLFDAAGDTVDRALRIIDGGRR